MPDDKRPQDGDEHDDDVAPSTLFLEMMRRAAAEYAPQDDAPQSFSDEPTFLNDIFYDDDVQPPKPPAEAPPRQSRQPDMIDIPQTKALPDAPPPVWNPPPEDPISDAPEEPEPVTQSSADDAQDAQDNPTPTPEPVMTEAPTPQPMTSQAPAMESLQRVPIYKAPPEEPAAGLKANPADDRTAAMEQQRVRRIRRRRERRRKRRMGALGGFISTLLIGMIAAGLASTIFTWFTSPDFIRQEVASGLQVADATSAVQLAAATSAVTPNWMQRIGVVSGHRGPQQDPNNVQADPGAVCPDGLTEAEINFAVAQRVVQGLRALGYTVDLLDEFDPRLNDYQAAALVSIHANDCRDYGEFVSGFLVARASARPPGGLDDLLAECIGLAYGRATQLERRFTLTVDMTDYHTFREIHPLTPAAILELGFMKDDRELLTNQQDLLASGIVAGIQCYLNGENPIMTPAPTDVPEDLAPAGNGG